MLYCMIKFLPDWSWRPLLFLKKDKMQEKSKFLQEKCKFLKCNICYFAM